MAVVQLAATTLASSYWYLAIHQRADDTAKSWKAENSSHDKGTTQKLLGVITGLLVLPWIYVAIFSSQSGSLLVDLILLAMIPLAILLRSWAMRTLGIYFTRTLRIREEHKVVSTGPYAYVRISMTFISMKENLAGLM
jgi:protein-S-isoprenylcysteine O-methyltransferase Ste14